MSTEEMALEYRDRIYFFLLKQLGDPDMAKDILQETFLKAQQKIGQLREVEKLESWLFQVARNTMKDHLAHEARLIPGPVHDTQDTSGREPEACCFDRFIEELPPDYRQSIELVYIEGKKQQEASQALGISLPNMKARIRRAKVMLKDKFAECCGYDLNENGKLVGEVNCPKCNTAD
ncbi:sigma-70 family RNA polymerase sigma factor [Zeaxanthinibacter sp. PT1]|uniref:sigma-70 family RNA polymerase sigma factor n=1 Tax=Zeaxanthinibacter TaxID=561554 RepID=UPI00234A7FCF|nr:sigma-70 family RNA polymerase sigma factor [Zeaxanthinibacter sp. PT1]MDC6350110.1 sigma-70 family RNA polymerase sigma factor [Zeaxanthinibacter sp. PT1]